MACERCGREAIAARAQYLEAMNLRQQDAQLRSELLAANLPAANTDLLGEEDAASHSLARPLRLCVRSPSQLSKTPHTPRFYAWVWHRP